MITNRHRIDYLLDVLAEPFPEKATKKSCACGKKSSGADDDFLKTKRMLIEEALLEALKLSVQKNSSDLLEKLEGGDLETVLDEMSEDEIGKLLKFVPLKIIDTHLLDLSLFLDPDRPTTVEEIIEWDRKHAQDFQKINI